MLSMHIYLDEVVNIKPNLSYTAFSESMHGLVIVWSYARAGKTG